jgi:hypothetical protein
VDECVFIGITKTACLFFNLYHSLMFSCFILHVRERNGSPNGRNPCWLDDDDDDDVGGGVLFTELQHTDTTSRCNCSRVWKVPTSNYGSQPSILFYIFFHMMIYCIKFVHDTTSLQTPLSSKSLRLSNLCGDVCSVYRVPSRLSFITTRIAGFA